MENNVFNRYEIKFLLSPYQRKMVENEIIRHMIPDSHGESTICNIYYDTPDFRLIRHSLEKPVYKEKLRLRCYGRIDSKGTAFIELKKKYKGIVYKRRLTAEYDSAVLYLQGDKKAISDSQIKRELDYFTEYYGNLMPAVYLCYDRTAYFDSKDSNIRLTLDRNIRYRKEDLDLTTPPGGKDILKPGESLMEIKVSGAIPLWLCEILTKYQIKRVSFSKYGRAYEDILRQSFIKKATVSA